MDRSELQQLSRLRQEEAEALLAAGHWAGAYYLLGYAVECALKAIISQQFGLHTIPEKKMVNDFYTHDLVRLLELSKLRLDLLAAPQRNFYWTVVKDWSEQVRYEPIVAERLARDLYDACVDPADGVLLWLRNHW